MTPDGLTTDGNPGEVAVVVLVNTAPGHLHRWIERLAFGKWLMRGVPGLTFLKVLGSGRDGGFVPIPSVTRQGLFCGFRTETDADHFLAGSPQFERYCKATSEVFTVKLRAYSARGAWSGVLPCAVTAEEPTEGPIVSLTRASIKPTKAWDFWRHAAPAEVDLQKTDGCLLSAGLGEAPFFRQATFTMWRDTEAMNRFARTGAHQEAIKAARSGQHFSEDLFARFVPSDPRGTWQGRSFDPTSTDG